MHLRSNGFWPLALAAGMLMVGAGSAGAWAQQPGAPSLTVDRDPVPSPDPDTQAAPAEGEAQGLAQQTIEKGAGGRYTLRENAYEVRLNATVVDNGGRSIQTLNKDAFHVYEDGVPQTISSFRHEDLPVSLGILIDSSG